MKVYLKVAALFLTLWLAPNKAVCQKQAEDSLNGYAIHATYRDLTVMFHALRGPKLQGAAGFTPQSALVIKRAV